MLVYLIIGFLLATIGITLLNCITDLINGVTELIKAHINVNIVKCHAEIEKLQEGEEVQTRAIGFTTTFEEDDDE